MSRKLVPAPLFRSMIFTSTPPTSQMQSASGKKCSPAEIRSPPPGSSLPDDFQQILAVAGQGERHDVAVADHASNLPEELIVFRWIALAQRVEKNSLLHTAVVDPNRSPERWALNAAGATLRAHWRRFRLLIFLFNWKIGSIFAESAAAYFLFLFDSRSST